MKWFCLTFTICLFPAPIKSLKTCRPGELSLASLAPTPDWQAFQLTWLVLWLKAMLKGFSVMKQLEVF